MYNTTTSLCHPAMLAKIRLAMRLAIFGRGELMNGHGHRCYVPNRKGNNVLRVSWIPHEKRFEIYGDQGRLVTNIVKGAFQRSQGVK